MTASTPRRLAPPPAWGDSLRLLVDSAGTIASGVGNQLVLLVSGPLVARMLNVDGRGYLAGLHIWPLLLCLVGGLGIPVGFTYFLARRPADAGRILGEVCRIAALQIVVLTALVTAVLWAWSRGKPAEVQAAIYPTAAILPAMLATSYARSVLQAEGRFTAFNVLRVLPSVLYAIAVATLFFAGERRLMAVAIAALGADLVPAVVALGLAFRRLRPEWRPLPGFRRELFAFSLRGHLGYVFPVSDLRVDQALVALYLSPTALGLYAVAYAFTNLPRFVAESVGKVAYPAIIVRQGTPEAARLVWRFFWGVVLFNLPIILVLMVLMRRLIVFFFGPEFAAAEPIAKTLLVGTTFVASRRILVETLRGLGRPTISTLAEVSMYPCLALAAPFAMVHYGAQGLATTLTLCYGLALAVAVVGARRALSPVEPAAGADAGPEALRRSPSLVTDGRAP